MSMMPSASQDIEAGIPMTPVILPMGLARSPAGDCTNLRAAEHRTVPFDATRKHPADCPQEFAFPAVLPDGEDSQLHRNPGAIWPKCDCTETAQASIQLAETLCRRLPSGRPTVLALTSPGDGDGKTSVMTALAPELARRSPGGVLVVDADFRKADLTGLLTLAASRTPDGSPLIYPTDLAGLNVLPRPPGLETHYFDAAWVEQIRDVSPLTLLDMASLEHAETPSLLRHCDGVCLVVRLGHTPRRAVVEAGRVIAACGGRLLGSIVVA